jgi:hypothetical protein
MKVKIKERKITFLMDALKEKSNEWFKRTVASPKASRRVT